MNLTQYLCQLLSEECNELGQRASKLSRFGHDEIQKGQNLDNYERMKQEKLDVMVVYDLLMVAIGKKKDTSIAHCNSDEYREKQRGIIAYARLSVTLGQLEQSVLEELIAVSKVNEVIDADVVSGA
jgi:hypothetical protein